MVVVVDNIVGPVMPLEVETVVGLLDVALVKLRLPQSRRLVAAESPLMSPTGRPRR